MSSRGDHARVEIVDEAMRLASVDGLEGLTLGTLARQLGRSKSGLFAHFDSKESLQMAVIETAAERFVDAVVRPAISEPRGLPRIEALMHNWWQWARDTHELPGGCLFVTLSVEYDDRPGPVRDTLVRTQREWIATLERAVEIAIDIGHLKDGVDSRQVAYELYSLMLGSHYFHRLLGDPRTLDRVERGFERLLDSIRA